MSESTIDVPTVKDRDASPGLLTDRPGKGRPRPLGHALMSRIAEPSLDAPPVYRRFLAGGSRSLWPSRFCLLATLVVGTGLFGAGWLLFVPNDAGANLVFLSTAAGALVCAVVLVLITSRWLGNRLGGLAGFVWLSSAVVPSGQTNSWLAVLFCLAMGLFAAAHVPGRLPTSSHRAIPWAFHTVVGLSFVLFGWNAAVVILAICLVCLPVSQNTRSVRFLANPVGLAILAMAIVGRWSLGQLVPNGHEAASLHTGLLTSGCALRAAAIPTRSVVIAMGALPWLPFATVALAVGLRQGHYATPFWRFLGCWILVPVGLIALGGTNNLVTSAAVTAPVCILAAAGLDRTISRIGWVSSLRNRVGIS